MMKLATPQCLVHTLKKVIFIFLLNNKVGIKGKGRNGRGIFLKIIFQENLKLPFSLTSPLLFYMGLGPSPLNLSKGHS